MGGRRVVELNSGFAGFFRADANRVFDGADENFTVSDFSSLRRLHNRAHSFIHTAVSNDQL